MCTPLMYDSRYQGSQRIRQVVHRGGVASAMANATSAATIALAALVFVRRETIPMIIMESPIVLRMSTRKRSVQGAQGWPRMNSCTRNRKKRKKKNKKRSTEVSRWWLGR